MEFKFHTPLPTLSKTERYRQLIPQLLALVEAESDALANLSNLASALHFGLENLWTGFYMVKGDALVLGPFQGPVACTRIGFGKGVCGTAWKENRTIIVPNVDEFEGHIACSTESKSEIVVPVKNENKVLMVLDMDSKFLNYYSEVDQKFLESLFGQISMNILL